MILSVGGFDVNNFGDLLFPFIIEHYINDEIHHFSPTGNITEWKDAKETKSFYELDKFAKNAKAIILSGGHLVSVNKTKIPEYSSIPNLNRIVYPAFWIYPSFLANKYNIPIIWNGLGVQNINKNEYTNFSNNIFCSIDYLAVRDPFSKSIIESQNCVSTLIPDTATDVSSIFSEKELSRYFIRFKNKRKIKKSKIGVFSLKKKYLDCDLLKVIESIEKISHVMKVTPVIIALGKCHGDDEIVKKLSTKFITIHSNYQLKEILAIISNAKFYCGSSLHGFISSFSFNVKSILIADEETIKFRKFSGYLEFFNLQNRLIKSWTNYDEIILQLKSNNSNVKPSKARKILDAHWENVRLVLNKKTKKVSHFSLKNLENIEAVTFFKKNL